MRGGCCTPCACTRCSSANFDGELAALEGRLDVGLLTDGPTDTSMIGRRHLPPRVRVLLDFLAQALVD